MQRTNTQVSDFNFSAWNFGEAKLALKYALKNQQKLQISDQEYIFLQSVLDKINELFQTLESLNKIPFGTTNEEDPAAVVKVFTIQLKESAGIIKKYSDDLEKQITAEYKSFYRRNAAPQIVPYFILLDNLLNCCVAINRNIDKTIEKSFTVPSVVLSANSLGANYFPMMQALDPLKGEGYDEEKRFIDSRGNCFGYVAFWAKTIHKTGTSTPKFCLDSKARKRQKMQNDIKSDCPSIVKTNIKNTASTLAKILNNLNPEGVYGLILKNETLQYGHALGIRRVGNALEFFDPNYGLFLFADDKSFINWFTRLINHYRCMGKEYDFNEVQVYLFDQQTKDAKSFLATSTKKDYHVTVEDILRIVKRYNTIYEREKQNGFSNLSVKRIQEIFLDEMPAHLSYLKIAEEIDVLKERLLACEFTQFIFDVDTRSRVDKAFNFFNTKNDKWQSTKAGLQLQNLLDTTKANLTREFRTENSTSYQSGLNSSLK